MGRHKGEVEQCLGLDQGNRRSRGTWVQDLRSSENPRSEQRKGWESMKTSLRTMGMSGQASHRTVVHQRRTMEKEFETLRI